MARRQKKSSLKSLSARLRAKEEEVAALKSTVQVCQAPTLQPRGRQKKAACGRPC